VSAVLAGAAGEVMMCPCGSTAMRPASKKGLRSEGTSQRGQDESDDKRYGVSEPAAHDRAGDRAKGESGHIGYKPDLTRPEPDSR
jgi:hypothetical protein